MTDLFAGPGFFGPAILAFVLAYGLGSIPFGLILTRLTGAGDLRAIGSGNIGATNVLRTGRKGLAMLTLLCDALKGAVAVAIAWSLAGPAAALIAGLGAVVGHCFSLWLRFAGGKGVATTAGVVLTLTPWTGLAALAFFGLIVGVTRYVSLGSVLAACAIAPLAYLEGAGGTTQIYLVIAMIIISKHHENIRRLINGTESKVGERPAG